MLPAPNVALLWLGVGAPELSPLLLVASLVLCALAFMAGARTLDRATGVVAAMAAMLCAWPLAQFPAAVRRFDAAIEALSPASDRVGPRQRARPLMVRDLLLGIDTGESRVVRGVAFAAPAGRALTADIYQPIVGGRVSDPRPDLRRRLAARQPGRRRGVRTVLRVARVRGLRHRLSARPGVAVALADLDRTLLEAAGYTVDPLRERPGLVEATVSRGGQCLLVEWARDSAFRFFPLVAHEELGLMLHAFDLATNKVLALVGRLEVRDWVDVISCDERLQPLGYLAWAACAKDPGFAPPGITAGTRERRRGGLRCSRVSS